MKSFLFLSFVILFATCNKEQEVNRFPEIAFQLQNSDISYSIDHASDSISYLKDKNSFGTALSFDGDQEEWFHMIFHNLNQVSEITEGVYPFQFQQIGNKPAVSLTIISNKMANKLKDSMALDAEHLFDFSNTMTWTSLYLDQMSSYFSIDKVFQINKNMLWIEGELIGQLVSSFDPEYVIKVNGSFKLPVKSNHSLN